VRAGRRVARVSGRRGNAGRISWSMRRRSIGLGDLCGDLTRLWESWGSGAGFRGWASVCVLRLCGCACGAAVGTFWYLRGGRWGCVLCETTTRVFFCVSFRDVLVSENGQCICQHLGCFVSLNFTKSRNQSSHITLSLILDFTFFLCGCIVNFT
jgi:hypothetical protein